MKYTEIKFMTRHNKGNYEHEEVTLTAIVGEDEFLSDVMAEMKVKAYQMFSFPTTAPEKSEEPVKVEETKVAEAPVKEKKQKKAKPVEEEKSASEKAADMIDGQEVPPVIPSDAEEMEVVESPYKKAPASTPKQKTIAYDLKNKDHRDRLAAFLNKEHPTWKTQPKDKLLAFSNGLVGKEFEDLNGNMLDSFKEIVSATFA